MLAFEQESRTTPAQPSLMNLLVIDDNPLDAGVAALVVGRQGHRVHCISRIAEVNLEQLRFFDVVVLDLMMPETDGVQWLRLLMERGISIKTILLSGLGERILKQARNSATCYGHQVLATLQKPLSVPVLDAALLQARALEGRAGSGSPSLLRPDTSRIESALLQGEFGIVLQPQIRLRDGAWFGVETLARWWDPAVGLVEPSAFIPQVEDSDLAFQFTLAILEKSLAAWQRLHVSCQFAGQISVNVPLAVLHELNLPEVLLGRLQHYGVPPACLNLEITERGLARSPSCAADVQTRLAMRGIHLSIDDFGTGYSGIQRLQQTLFNELKIDSCFVTGLVDDEEAQHIVRNMIQLGHDLGMWVVAEGVESEATRDWLLQAGCDVGQGYFFGRPVDIDKLICWAHTNDLQSLAVR